MAPPAGVGDTSVEAIVGHYQREVQDTDALATAAHVQLFRTFGAVSDALNTYLEPYGLTRSRYNVLRLLYFSPRQSLKMSEIGAGLRVSKTNVTSLVGGLARLGLVIRRVPPDDRRSVQVELTPEGRRCIRRLLPGYLRHISQMWSALDESRKHALIDALRTLHQHLTQMPPPAALDTAIIGIVKETPA